MSTITDDRAARWEQLRRTGAAAYDQMMAAAFAEITDPLERLAYYAGTRQGTPDATVFDGLLLHLEAKAAADGRTWREISTAEGQGDDEQSWRRVYRNHHRQARDSAESPGITG